MKTRQLALALITSLAVATCGPATHAISVDLNTAPPPTGDEDGDFFKFLGLEWLRWDITIGMSINEAVSAYKYDGWRLASNSEMANMLNYWEFPGFTSQGPDGPFDDDENTGQTKSDLTASSGGLADAVTTLFGVTSHYCDETSPTDPECSIHTSALFGEDDDGDGLYNLFNSVYRYWPDLSYIDVSLYADNYDGDYAVEAASWRSYTSGVALVRDVTPVPLPASFSLFLSALLAFGLLKKARSKKRERETFKCFQAPWAVSDGPTLRAPPAARPPYPDCDLYRKLSAFTLTT